MSFVSTSVISPAQKRQFDDQGYTIARGLFAPDEVQLIRDTFMAQAKDGPVKGLSEVARGSGGYAANDPLARYPRMIHPHAHAELAVGPLATKYMLDRRIYDALKVLMDEEPLAAQSMFYFKPPGARGQDLHQDNFYLRVKPGTCVAAWTAIDDADEENGGMVLVPRSNRMDIVCPEKADTEKFFTDHHVSVPSGLHEEPARMKAGDVLFFNGSVIHGSYPNTSKDRFRRALICHYVPQSTVEIASFYKPVRFDAEPVKIAEATGGGPCGGEFVPAAAH